MVCNMNKMDVSDKKYGIDIEILFDEKVLSNKKCFWTLLQSHTDRLHHYYHDEEKHIIKAIRKLDEKNLLNLKLLERFQNDVYHLHEFIKLNVDLFVLAVRKFDEKHETDTFEEELEYFQETYKFSDGHRLFNILSAIDAFIYEIESTSKKAARSKKKHLVQQSEQDVVRYDSVNRKDGSFKKLMFTKCNNLYK